MPRAPGCAWSASGSRSRSSTSRSGARDQLRGEVPVAGARPRPTGSTSSRALDRLARGATVRRLLAETVVGRRGARRRAGTRDAAPRRPAPRCPPRARRRGAASTRPRADARRRRRPRRGCARRAPARLRGEAHRARCGDLERRVARWRPGVPRAPGRSAVSGGRAGVPPGSPGVPSSSAPRARSRARPAPLNEISAPDVPVTLIRPARRSGHPRLPGALACPRPRDDPRLARRQGALQAVADRHRVGGAAAAPDDGRVHAHLREVRTAALAGAAVSGVRDAEPRPVDVHGGGVHAHRRAAS